jgi:hypothetical protein
MAMFFLGQFLRVADPPQDRAKARAKILALASKYGQNLNSEGIGKPSYKRINTATNYLVLVIAIQGILISGLLLFFARNRLFKSRPIKIDSNVINDKFRKVSTKNKVLSKKPPCTGENFIDIKLLQDYKRSDG